MEIPIRDKTCIISYAKVDEEDYEKVNSLFWNLDKDGYVQNSVYRLHRFIMNANINDPLVDHINGDKLDNRKRNLRFATSSQNAQNKSKSKKECHSKYIGVTKCKDIWQCQIRINNNKKTTSFKIEDHAAWWYDQLALKHYGPDAKINGIKQPDDFIIPIEIKKKKYKNITLTKSNTFHTTFPNKGKIIYVGTFKTEEEALIAYNNKKEEIEKEEEIQRFSKKILKNKDGNTIIKTLKNEEIIVDENLYYELVKYSWYINKGYVYGNKKTSLHRYLMNAKNGEIVDHINGNKLDNRLVNLRISNSTLNGHNRIKKKGTDTKYIGVKYTKSGKYESRISKDKIQYNLGTYETEEDAAKARDKKAIELYGEFAKLNL